MLLGQVRRRVGLNQTKIQLVFLMKNHQRTYERVRKIPNLPTVLKHSSSFLLNDTKQGFQAGKTVFLTPKMFR